MTILPPVTTLSVSVALVWHGLYFLTHLFFKTAYFPPLECELLQDRDVWGDASHPQHHEQCLGSIFCSGPLTTKARWSLQAPWTTVLYRDSHLTVLTPQLNSRDEKRTSSDLSVGCPALC